MKKGVKILSLFLIMVSGIFFVSMVALDNYSLLTGKAVAYSYQEFWNKITGSAVGEGYCSGGNIPPCESFSYRLTCNLEGCSWDGENCIGSPKPCNELDTKLSCDNQKYCKWYAAPSPQRTGTPSALTSQPSGGTPSQTSTTSSVEFSDTGYIIEFQDEPIIAKKAELEKEAKEFEELRQRNPALATLLSPFRVSLDEVPEKARKYSEDLKRNHNEAKQQITNRISKQADRDYENVFNGIALDITQDEANSLLDLNEIKSIQPDYSVNLPLQESVPAINANYVWKLDANGNDCVTSGQSCLTGQGVVIGNIDTGVDYNHPDLGNGCFGNSNCKVIGGYDFWNNDNDPMDDYGHGTPVTAILAGNGILKGVAPDAKIVAYKVYGSSGGTFNSKIIAAIERSVDPNQDGNFDDHLDIINIEVESLDSYDAVSLATDNAVKAGVVAVVAAGNYGPDERTIGSPGNAISAITVGATNYDFSKVASFSSRGPVTIDLDLVEPFTINKPDVVAPGPDTCAAKSQVSYISNFCLDSYHTSFGGTSAATPHVSGAVALLLQAYPTASPSQIKDALTSTATDLGEPITAQGAGLINVQRAINSLVFIPLPPPGPPTKTFRYVFQRETTYDPIKVLFDAGTFPSCPCDTNPNTKDCPNEFTITSVLLPINLESGGVECYDHYTTTGFGGRLLYGVRKYILANSPPTIPLIPVLSVPTGHPLSYDVDATDADGNALTYSLTTNPGWLSIDSATGLITGKAPIVDVITDYDAVVSVSDGTNSANRAFNVHVGLPLPPKSSEENRTSEESCRPYFTSCSCSYVCRDTPFNDCQRACSPMQRSSAVVPTCGYVNGICQEI